MSMLEYSWTMINTGNQYRDDIFNKLGFDFAGGGKILDVGCGGGFDAEIFINEYGLATSGIDIFEHERIKNIKGLEFKKAGISEIPFGENQFDFVFAHDVLHHIDEEHQSYEKHRHALEGLKRVCKTGGSVVIVEANRYNPLLYPYMTLLRGHQHFKQNYFKKLVRAIFPQAKFKCFECHNYPKRFVKLFKIYEKIMEGLPFLRPFLSYNAAIIKNNS